MPIIKGAKFSWYLIPSSFVPIFLIKFSFYSEYSDKELHSEPCIRGHRATSCAHTDRILIEVRKPGRPLESCGHSFNSCQCGKVAELLALENGSYDPRNSGSFHI